MSTRLYAFKRRFGTGRIAFLAGVSICVVHPVFTRASDVTLTTGLDVTPNREATTENKVWNQESRLGPSAGIAYSRWFGKHGGVFAEVDYGNTNTRLEKYWVNTWTMNRVTLDGGYEYRWAAGRFTPYAKIGCGATVFISGMALNGTSAGLDKRMDGVAGLGSNYRLSRGFSAQLEYEGTFLRNPDFTDHTWKPQRNWVSEPKIGITYTFGASEREK